MAASPLAAYNAKRDFARTAEPPGQRGKARNTSLAFVVQKHAATRLHWDFRLELDGVLLSWAVTRGPSNDPAVRRLAVRTEDHPIAYGSFEGTIPKEEYGGGTVMLWDHGTWEPIDEPRAGVSAGKFHFRLHGDRMKGEWVLIRLKPDAGKPSARENWLLFKIADADAEAGAEDALTNSHLTSITTGRSMDAIAAGEPSTPKKAPAPAKPSAKARKEPATTPPAFREPQLATLVDSPPTGNDWLHETKYDGYRALIAIGGGTARIYTRSGLDWTDKFGDVADAAAALPCDSALIDTEICTLDVEGRPNFGALQAALKNGGAMVAFAFDLLELDSASLTDRPLTERKSALARLFADVRPPLVYAEHVRGGGERMFAALCGAGYEGVVSKRAEAPYRPGRSKTWLKSKCTRRQEFVIGGWSQSSRRHGFASLLLGVNENGELRYSGRVGTGFDDDTLAEIGNRLAALASRHSPFAGALPAEARRGAHFVEPRLVAEIAFAELTRDGLVRHASFIGLREDKAASDVVVETPVDTSGAVAALGITISSPERIVFPDLGLTKQALAEYYAMVAEPMLEDMADRPISLVRCPQGRARQCFFQRHDSGMFPDSVRHIPITEADGKIEDYLYVRDAAGLVACVQMGTIEFHGWGSRVADIERPDRLVFDLDPDEGLGFDAVRAAAVLVRDRLKARGLASLPMLTGGKGVHVVAPLEPDADWGVVKPWARAFAEDLAGEFPNDFTATMRKTKRRGRIFIDWLRNQRGATAVMPFSVRAREGGGVAVPIDWSCLADIAAGNAFTVADPATILVAAKGRGRVEASSLKA